MRTLLFVVFLAVLTQCTSHPESDKVRREVASLTLDESGYRYDPNDRSCGGFPRLMVQTMPGTCLGLVIGVTKHKEDGKPVLTMPRTIVKIPDSDDFLLTDMGGWAPKRGRLYWMKKDRSGQYSLTKILDALDTPHGLLFNERDGYFYLGENNRIFRFRFENGRIGERQTVVDNMPDVAKHMHPLTQMVFNPANGDLYINSGAPTDHCYQADGNYKKRCPEEAIQKMATIQRIPHEKLADLPKGGLGARDIHVVAQGLRNSMAMAIHPAGRFLIQGENGRDFPELEEPYEELNVIRLDQPGMVKHYGWPYCYNNHATSPEWDDIFITDRRDLDPANQSRTRKLHGENPFYCGREAIPGLKDYQRPYSLIPPHAAPLFAEYYSGKMFEDVFGGHLLMSWHGHRTTGQRFVSYAVNAEGLPKLIKPGKESYRFNLPDGCPKPAPFNPRGGFRQHFAPYSEIISGWGPIKGIRPKGAPTGFTVANDGSVWIVEDKNKTVVRLARSAEANYQQACDTTPGSNKDLNVPLLVWRNALLETSTDNRPLREDYNFIAKGLKTQDRCLKCHESFVNKDLGDTPDEFTSLDFFVRSGWLVPGKPDKSLLYGAITGNGMAPPMPPAGFSSLKDDAEGLKIIDTLEKWIAALPQDIDDRWEQVSIKGKLNIRPRPTTNSTPCGQFQDGDIAYIDPRSATKIRADNIGWSKVYLVPGHTRLKPGACRHPLDGVFYIAK